MEVLEVNDDGRIVLDMTEEEQRILIEYAVVNLLKEYIERIKNEHGASGYRGEVLSEELSERKDL